MKKFISAMLSLIMALTLFLALPALQVSAEENDYNHPVAISIFDYTESMDRVSISTPGVTAAMYAGLTTEQQLDRFGLHLYVTDRAAAASTNTTLAITAQSKGLTVVSNLQMDLRLQWGMFYSQVKKLADPIRVAFWPANMNPNLDYGALILLPDGTYDLVANLDPTNTMVTFDTKYMDNIAIVSAPKGSLTLYLRPDAKALTSLEFPVNPRSIYSSIETMNINAYVAGGVQSDAAAVKAATGTNAPYLKFIDWEPAEKDPIYASFENARKLSGGEQMHVFDVYVIDQNNGKEIESTETPLIMNFSVPQNLPIYGEYAVAVLDMKGQVQVLKDLDTNPTTVTIQTNLFRKYAIIWGPEGTLKEVK